MIRKILIIISFLLLICSCRHTKEIAKSSDEKQTRIEQNTKVEKDSVFVYRQDTVLVKEKNYTVYIEKIKYEYLYKINNNTDTIIRTDTIYRTQTIEKVVEDRSGQIRYRIERIILITIIVILIGIGIWRALRRYIRN